MGKDCWTGEKQIGVAPFADYQFLRLKEMQGKCRQDKKDEQKLIMAGNFY